MTRGAKIFLIEDDDSIADFLTVTLESRGFEVARADNGLEALQRFPHERPDAVLLDLNLPGLEGTEVLKEIRAASDVPVLIVSVRNDEVDKVCTLESGADDYITKPFSARELIARIRTNLRGVSPVDETFQHEGLEINWKRAEVFRDGAKVILSKQEFQFLHFLYQNRDRALTRSHLIERLWGYDFNGEERVVDTTVKRLRRKVGPRYIETVRGLGYRFRSL